MRLVFAAAFLAAALAGGSRAPAQESAGGDDARAAKCAALGECRTAFARCKRDFIEETGRWELEDQPCGERYQACIREHFAPGEMAFTRWFWPYEGCP